MWSVDSDAEGPSSGSLACIQRQLCAQRGAGARFNWRAGLPLKSGQPMRVGAHSRPANQGKKLHPSLRVASTRRPRTWLNSTLTSA